MRVSVQDFSLANPIYAGAIVTFFTVSGGVKTTTLSALYAAPSGSAALLNPQTLDSEGKFRQAVYIDAPTIATVSGLTIADHDTGVLANITDLRFRVEQSTAKLQYSSDGGVSYNDTGDTIFRARGGWATSTVYGRNDTTTFSSVLYYCLVPHTSGVFATDLAAGKWAIVIRQDVVYAANYGVTGDDVDCDAALHAAVAAAKGKGVLQLPPGTVRYSTPLDFDGWIAAGTYPNTYVFSLLLKGCKTPTTSSYNSDTIANTGTVLHYVGTGVAISTNYCNVSFEDFNLEGTSAAQGGFCHGLEATGESATTYTRNVNVYGFEKGKAAALLGNGDPTTDGYGIRFTREIRRKMELVESTQNTYGIIFDYDWATNHNFNTCAFRYNYAAGAYFRNCYSTQFDNCNFEYNDGPGIILKAKGNGVAGANGVRNIVFRSPWIEGNCRVHGYSGILADSDVTAPNADSTYGTSDIKFYDIHIPTADSSGVPGGAFPATPAATLNTLRGLDPAALVDQTLYQTTEYNRLYTWVASDNTGVDNGNSIIKCTIAGAGRFHRNGFVMVLDHASRLSFIEPHLDPSSWSWVYVTENLLRSSVYTDQWGDVWHDDGGAETRGLTFFGPGQQITSPAPNLAAATVGNHLAGYYAYGTAPFAITNFTGGSPWGVAYVYLGDNNAYIDYDPTGASRIKLRGKKLSGAGSFAWFLHDAINDKWTEFARNPDPVQTYGTCTLAAGAATTTVNDANVLAGSMIFLMPTSANAAADVTAGVYISAKVAGTSFTITHPNNANADKTFNYIIAN